MSTTSKELKYYICQDHIERYERTLKRIHPGYRFNTYVSICANRKCTAITSCDQIPYYECIGVLVPETVSKLDIPKKSKPVQEIFWNAKHILDGGPALERLMVFLKTKVIPQNSGIVCDNIFRHHARLILKSLKIDEECSLSDTDKDKILRELELYPADFINK